MDGWIYVVVQSPSRNKSYLGILRDIFIEASIDVALKDVSVFKIVNG